MRRRATPIASGAESDAVASSSEAAVERTPLQLAFDASYEESRRYPMKFCYACHVHVSGRPGMSKLLDHFIGYVRGHDGVQFYPCIDIANFWLEREGNKVP